jgi:hypothetical protein
LPTADVEWKWGEMTSRSAYSDDEWGLLVGLPQSVMIAASAAEDDGSRRTLSEGEAGLDAIAAGRESANPLVRDVASEVVERVGGPEVGAETAMVPLPDRDAGLAEVLDRARGAAMLLTAKAPAGDAAAYKHWVVGIAEQVVGAARSGGFLGIGGEWVSESERRFVDELSAILND